MLQVQKRRTGEAFTFGTLPRTGRPGLGFRVQGSGFRAEGSGLRVKGAGTIGASQYSGLPTLSNHAQPDAAVAQMHVASLLSSGDLHVAQGVWGSERRDIPGQRQLLPAVFGSCVALALWLWLNLF